MVVLDFLREHEQLKGTKAACREGDCGSCSVLVGALSPGENAVRYKAMASCLLPLGDMEGKHLVSIEGLNPGMETTMSEIPVSPVQRIFIEEGATQCGFCTPGFVIALTFFLLEYRPLTVEGGLDAVSGNVCRCTGYGSIKRSIVRLVEEYGDKLDAAEDRIDVLIEEGVLPPYFKEIPGRIAELSPAPAAEEKDNAVLIAGGTDLYVRKAEDLSTADVSFVSRSGSLAGVTREGDRCRIGAGTSMEELKNNSILREVLPDFARYLHLIASTQIRQRATVGGNIVNASPIGDLSVFFLSLGAKIGLRRGRGNESVRSIRLEDFFLDYKKLDLQENESLEYVEFTAPDNASYVNFEKVSRRTHLDIAGVNTAIRVSIDGDKENRRIRETGLSAGGVAPVPLLLSAAADYMTGKELSIGTIKKAAEVADGEISPISDIRGSAEYKRLLLRQLFFAHFITLFPEVFGDGELL